MQRRRSILNPTTKKKQLRKEENKENDKDKDDKDDKRIEENKENKVVYAFFTVTDTAAIICVANSSIIGIAINAYL